MRSMLWQSRMSSLLRADATIYNPNLRPNEMPCAAIIAYGNKKAGTYMYHMMSKTPPRLSIALHQMQSERLTGLCQQDMRSATSAKRKPKDL